MYKYINATKLNCHDTSVILAVIFGKVAMTSWGVVGAFLATIYVGYAVGKDYVTDGAIMA